MNRTRPSAMHQSINKYIVFLVTWRLRKSCYPLLHISSYVVDNRPSRRRRPPHMEPRVLESTLQVPVLRVGTSAPPRSYKQTRRRYTHGRNFQPLSDRVMLPAIRSCL